MAFPVSDSFIKTAEAELGCSLPLELQLRLGQSNGGEVLVTSDLYPEGEEWELYSVKDTSDRKHLARSIRSNIVNETTSAREWTAFPRQGVAIGSNGSGDLLVFLRGSPQIWTWDHETGEMFKAVVHWAGR